MSKIQKNLKKNKDKNSFWIFILRKNINIHAGAPKFAQELFFWSYRLRVCSSYWRKYFVVEDHCYIQLYSSAVLDVNCFGNFIRHTPHISTDPFLKYTVYCVVYLIAPQSGTWHWPPYLLCGKSLTSTIYSLNCHWQSWLDIDQTPQDCDLFRELKMEITN